MRRCSDKRKRFGRSIDARIAESRPEKTGHSLEPAYPTPGKTETSLAFEFHRVLVGFELTVAWCTSARRLAILGASGSGKSMTLRLMAGLDRSETATLFVNGDDLSVRPPESRAIAYVPQSYGLFPHLPVDRQIRFSANCDSNIANHWAARLGLEGLEHRYLSELSIGQRQRVALARALGRQANLLLLDEPFSTIDAPLRARLRREFLQLQEEFNTITILVTHDPAEAIFLADELLLLDNGRVLQTGPVNQVFLRPANEMVARLLGAENIGYGRAVAPDSIDVGAEVRIAVSGPPLEPFRPIGWSVRPERIRFAADGPYSARILHLGNLRDGQRSVTVQLGDSVFEVTTDPGFRPVNDDCHVAIDPQALQIWHVAK